MALCLAISPSSVIGVLTHHSETTTTLKFVCHLGLNVIFLIEPQYVVYNNNSSIVFSITHGVPQGSILGTLLFLIYIFNDLTHSSKNDIVTIICDKFTSTNWRLQLHLDVKWRSFLALVFSKKQKQKQFFFFSFFSSPPPPPIGVRFALYTGASYTREIYDTYLTGYIFSINE